MITVASMFKNKVCAAIAEAERLLGTPPNMPQVEVVFQHDCTGVFGGFVNGFIQNLYREDLFYADKEFIHWSMTGSDGTEEKKTFERFSERFRRIYPGYLLNRKQHVVAAPETPVINLR